MVEHLVVGLIVLCAFGLALLTGIPVCIFGTMHPEYYQCDELTSVPLWPTTSDNFSYWVGVAGDYTTTDYPNDSILSLPISMNSFPIEYRNEQTHLHIIHNLYGYQINAKLTSGIREQEITFYKERNMLIGEPDFFENETTYAPGDFQKSLRKHGGYRIRCPYHTVITAEAQIEPRCNRSEGYFMELSGRYEDMVAFNFTPEALYGEEMRLVFSGLRVLPTNFVETPQMFIGIWQKSRALTMIIAGAVTTVVGLLGVIIIVVLFFTCDPLT